jgi:hypothetical protein
MACDGRGGRKRVRSRRWWSGFEVSRSNCPGGGQSTPMAWYRCLYEMGVRPQEGPQQALVVRLRSFAVKLSWRRPIDADGVVSLPLRTSHGRGV